MPIGAIMISNLIVEPQSEEEKEEEVHLPNFLHLFLILELLHNASIGHYLSRDASKTLIMLLGVLKTIDYLLQVAHENLTEKLKRAQNGGARLFVRCRRRQRIPLILFLLADFRCQSGFSTTSYLCVFVPVSDCGHI